MEHHDVSYQGDLTFISDFEPSLDTGRYSLEVYQEVKKPDGTFETTMGDEVTFVVSGPQFVLDEGDIFSCYPPSGGKADYDGVVPSISFSRRTLPWERSPSPVDRRDGAAWLALILLDEDDFHSGAVREVLDSGRRPLLEEMKPWLGLDDIEPWTDEKTAIRALEIESELFDALLPTYGDLALLSHARRNTTDGGVETSELGTVLCNRLPTPGQINTVFLVSVEQRYPSTDADCPARHVGPEAGKQRLAILHRWDFHCRYAEHYNYTVTPDILRHLAREGEQAIPSDPFPAWVGFEYEGDEGRDALGRQVAAWLDALPQSSADELADRIIELARHRDGTFVEILQNVRVGTLRDHPEPGASVPTAARELLDTGHTVLKHHLRGGGTTYSWLKGALSPGPMADSGLSLPAASADDLLIFHRTNGMFDASFAAAWALGRLQGMERKSLSTALFRWRHEQLHARTGHGHDHLPVPKLPDSPLPEEIVEQVEEWKLLRGIPFEYLVPHPKLLPAESLRFFHLDPNWMRCFLDGFFSVAKVHGLADVVQEQALFPGFDRPITGVLLRSEAVAGWPSMHVNAFAESVSPDDTAPDAQPVRILRKQRLQTEVLLVLFDGIPKTIDLFQSPEGVHSGFERADSDADSPRYTLRVRDLETGAGDRSHRVVAIDGQRGSQHYRTFSAMEVLQQVASAPVVHPGRELAAVDLGLQLMDGAPLVRFPLIS